MRLSSHLVLFYFLLGISPLFCALTTSLWAVILFVVTLSFGEAIWSPRVYDYTISVAPEVGFDVVVTVIVVIDYYYGKAPYLRIHLC